MKERLLIITETRYVSALLFHGYGCPPWCDLPEIQEKPEYRNRMTDVVNELVEKAARDGFTLIDVHEAFPVNLMTVSDKVEVLRNVDHFMWDRQYSHVAFAKVNFKSLSPQPKLDLIDRIFLDNHEVDEEELLRICFGVKSISLFDEVNRNGKCPKKIKLVLNKKISPKYVAEHPFIKLRENTLEAKVESVEMLLEVYCYAGIQIQSSGVL